MLPTALHYSHQLLREIIVPGDTVIDGTVGNGHDTLFLADLVGSQGHVYGFDIQGQAIDTSQQKLIKAGLTAQTTLLHQGHETIPQVLDDHVTVKAAIFNLGYLPQSDKTIITKKETTLTALDSLLPKLVVGGRVIIVIYYGHEGGEIEKDGVLAFVKTIPQQDYNVLSYQFINQQNNPPILIAIERKKASHP
ncbi:class I SAM-dependent methyltransferase [Vagococcus sp. BWB3-3]|uniref:Class I SAM-dependent methyltransferase n=1 Tax=Vagococcus allomyrinae TaxID=2794353 RepID=A0A940P992_9ENTE|nr:class I SAM-dependent methyltransferase [Vagococcus allomyrinae]MBP1040450.1 class I SAM-dependent methyltransferase [Vagococcus allomyrinae]